MRRRPKGPAGGQFSPEDRPDDPPVDADELLRQATDAASAADPEDDTTGEAAEPVEDENDMPLLRPHITKQSKSRR